MISKQKVSIVFVGKSARINVMAFIFDKKKTFVKNILKKLLFFVEADSPFE